MRPGQRIAERFEIENLAGAGGMGAVFRARDLVRDRTVALKLLKRTSRGQIARFAREAAVLAELRHDAIAQYHEHGTLQDGAQYLVMEWLDGPTLAERIVRRPLTVEEGMRLGGRIAEALGVAHGAGIVHRDVKPGNIMLPADDVARAKLLDFGLARHLDGNVASLTETGAFLGTLRYMAPEQARNAKRVDARADVYALGTVLFECLSGRHAIDGGAAPTVLARIVLEPTPRLREVVPGIAPAIDEAIAAMMAKDPQARPADGWAVRALLEELARSAAGCAPLLESLSERERRLMWVMVMDLDDGDVLTRVQGATEPLDPVDSSPVSVLEAHGGELQPLANGTALVTFRREPSDDGERAAMAALSWRVRYPSARIALAAGPGVQLASSADSAGAVQVGAIVERATAALAGGTPGTIRVDPPSAALLERQFVMRADEGGVVLLAKLGGEEGLSNVLGRKHPCIGRTRELATLAATLEDCVEQSVARAVLVQGDAGIGKSRLLRELALRAGSREGTRIMGGRVDVLQDGAPFALLADVLRRAAAIAQDDDLESARHKLGTRVGLHVPRADRGRVASFLGEMMAIPFEDDVLLRSARNDAALMGDAIERAVEDFFAAEAGASPLLLLLEDVHRADAPSLRLLRAVLRHLRERPLMIAAAGRPESEERFGELWRGMGADVITLAPLTAKASERLVGSILGDDAGAETIAQLAQKSGGNPLFLEELARAAAHGRRGVADNIFAAVQARLDALDGATRLVLRAASVFGTRFWPGGVTALVGSGHGAVVVERCIDELERRELVRRSRSSTLGGERELAFAHDLIHEVAYGMLTDEDRERGHALAGAWLERAGARDADMLANHYRRGGMGAEALPWLQLAAQQALDGHDFERAVARADEAVSGDAVAMNLVKSDALRLLGRYDDALHCARAVLAAAARGTSPWYRAAAQLALCSMQAKAVDELVLLCGDLHHIADGEAATADGLQALCMIGWSLQQAGRLDLAYPLVDRAERLAGAGGFDDPLSRAHLSAVGAVRAYNRGDVATYLRQSERAQELYEAAGDMRRSCGQALNVTVGYVGVGCYERAAEVAAQLLGLVRRLQLRANECFALALIGNAKLELGDLDGAESAATEARAIGDEIGHQRHLGYAELVLGRIATARRAYDAAIRQLECALSRFASLPPHRVHALGAIAEAHLRRGDAQAALRYADEAKELLDRVGVGGTSSSHIALIRAEACIALDRVPEAVIIVGDAVGALTARAGDLRDEWLRDRYLRNVAAHARLRALARDLAVSA